LAAQVVQGLVDDEGFDPSEIVVVVNGDGGLADPELAERVRMLHLPANLGPAGGFAHGLRAAFAEPDVQWAYLCEDDVGLFDLPAPRVRRVLAEVAAREAAEPAAIRAGAVVAYGRRIGSHASSRPIYAWPVYLPDPAPPLQPVDAAMWGAALVRRSVVEAGILPDEQWFFGYEDLDFFLRMRQQGFALLVDAWTGRAVEHRVTGLGREAAFAGQRPLECRQPWWLYYYARNYIPLARRHGNWRWIAWHLYFTTRWAQAAPDRASRRAIGRGLWDGLRGKLGPNSRYLREIGELAGH
jgi:GT2 family glycosyltransferase